MELSATCRSLTVTVKPCSAATLQCSGCLVQLLGACQAGGRGHVYALPLVWCCLESNVHGPACASAWPWLACCGPLVLRVNSRSTSLLVVAKPN